MVCIILFQVILCKGSDHKVGLRVKNIDKGIFVCFVKANSPAALASKIFMMFPFFKLTMIFLFERIKIWSN